MNIAVKQDQWDRWRAALAGEKIDLGARGDMCSGYFRLRPWKGKSPQEQEVVAIWRDEGSDEVQCWRSIGKPATTALEIDAIFEGNDFAAIPAELYASVVERGEPWPEIYTTWLPTKDITAGVVWTEAWARKFLAQNPETHDEQGNPRAVIGDNGAPEDLSPPEALAKRIVDLGALLGAWLDKVGGKPKTQADAEILAPYANRFKDLANEATNAHRIEKEPHLKAGRDVDAKWFAPVRDKADDERKRVLVLLKEFTDGEDRRKADERRAAQAQQAAAVETHAKRADEPAPIVAPPAEPEKTKIAGLRGGLKSGPTFAVVDLGKIAAYFATLNPPPPDFVSVCEKIAHKLGINGLVAPGVEKR